MAYGDKYEITLYQYTGYSPNDEPESDSVIELNTRYVVPVTIADKVHPTQLRTLRIPLTRDRAESFDFCKVTDTASGQRWYFYVMGVAHSYNFKVQEIAVVIDWFATVGLANIQFLGNIVRRSLSGAEAENYPLVAEPWAPRRPLKVRRIVLDFNVNKTARLPSHVSTSFQEETTTIQPEPNPVVINVPNSPLQLTTTADSLDFRADLPMIYPNIAADTSHSISTPWGSISYTTPYEQYYNLSGSALTTFLEKAKRSNSLDLVQSPYYLPQPPASQSITITELSNAGIENPKASRHFTTITIRSLASNSSQTYTDNNIRMSYNQEISVIVVPDKNGGIYVLPRTLRDTGLNAYTYMDGVYSPFETITFNAVGDTPAKFASDGTLLLNQALNTLFQQYISKVNALQYQGMQSKYFKDIASSKSLVMPFLSEVLGGISTMVTSVAGYWQRSTTENNVPAITQTVTQSQYMPLVTQSINQTNSTSGYTQTQTSSMTIPGLTTRSTMTTSNAAHSQTQSSYSYYVRAPGDSVQQSMPAITTNIGAFSSTSNTTSSQPTYTQQGRTTVQIPAVSQHLTGSTTIPAHTITMSSSNRTPGYTQTGLQNTWVEPQSTVATTTQQASMRTVEEGVELAIDGIDPVYEVSGAPISGVTPGIGANNAYGILKNILSKGYVNEVHSFMLGNINDYINRWVSIQNDMHNGKVANLFKNVTLVGGYAETNKLVGKYEILIASLQPDDEANFNLFLKHFGHGVDEFSTSLVQDVGGNYNYTMIGDDAVIHNNVLAQANGPIKEQFRGGVRVWKTLIRPGNY